MITTLPFSACRLDQRSFRKTMLLILSFLACFLQFTGVCRANQVTNPFFTGTTTAATSWTSSAPTYTSFNFALTPANASITADGGSTQFRSGCTGAACLSFPLVSGTSSGAQQSIPTTSGQNYTISFWTYFSAANNASVQIDVYWGNTRIYSGGGASASTAGWTKQTINLGVAASSSNLLTVLIRDDPSYSSITDIDIEPVGPKLSFAKTGTPICNPVTGNSNSKLIPGSAVQYAVTINNTGTASATLTTITETLASTVSFDSKLNSGALPTSNCVAGNLTNSLSATGFAMHSGSGVGPGVAAPGVAADAVTAGASISGQAITINFATLATAAVAAPAAASLAAGNYITVYFNAFIN